jgi:hypothetical protein
MAMFRTVLILHILQKHLLLIGSMRGLVFKSSIESVVQLPTRLQNAKRMKNVHQNAMYSHHWSNFRIISGPLLAHNLQGEVFDLFVLSFLPR